MLRFGLSKKSWFRTQTPSCCHRLSHGEFILNYFRLIWSIPKWAVFGEHWQPSWVKVHGPKTKVDGIKNETGLSLKWSNGLKDESGRSRNPGVIKKGCKWKIQEGVVDQKCPLCNWPSTFWQKTVHLTSNDHPLEIKRPSISSLNRPLLDEPYTFPLTQFS